MRGGVRTVSTWPTEEAREAGQHMSCICNHNTETTDGPDECCPKHGRTYAEWIERGDILQQRLEQVQAQALAFRQRALDAEARLARVEALIEGVADGNLKTSYLRAALETNIADDYERGRVHAEDDAYRHLRAALAASDAPDGSGRPDAPGGPGGGESEGVEGGEWR